MSSQSLAILWLLARSYSLGNMRLMYKKKILQNYYQKHMVLTWHPHEVCRRKAEIFFPSQTIFGNEKKWILWEYSPLYAAIKQPQRQLLFSTEHTGEGWFCSDASNDALCDACLQFISYLHRFHSGDELERRTWRQTIRDWDEENQFQSPKDSRCRRSLNTNSCFVALESWGGFCWTTMTDKNCGPAKHH